MPGVNMLFPREATAGSHFIFIPLEICSGACSLIEFTRFKSIMLVSIGLPKQLHMVNNHHLLLLLSVTAENLLRRGLGILNFQVFSCSFYTLPLYKTYLY